MKEKQITPGDAGRRLDRYLGRTFSSLPRSLMYKEIRKKNIKVNKKRCTPEQVLSAGDRVTLYLPDDVLAEKTVYYDFLSASKALDVVYEDENLLILNKPQGLLCHPNGKEYIDTLIARVKRYLYERNQWSPEDSGFAPALANRIDRNTGGLVIAAKTAPALREITALIRDRKIEKFYLTVTEGIPPKAADTLTAYLHKDEKKNKVTLYDAPAPDRMACKTGYRVLDTKANRALLEVELFTGRTHQIRAQLAGIGCPLAGDGKYGNTHGRYRQALLSYKLIFHVPADYTIAHLDGKVFTADTRSITQIFTGDDSNER